MFCNCCGTCCKAIYYSKPVNKLDNNNPDELFILINWTQILKSSAVKINSRLRNIKGYFYTCKHIDMDTNKCKIHEKRPNICSGYPGYMKLSDQLSYSKNCGYFK